VCGIVGFVADTAETSDAAALPFLLEGLARLEYRGYDSAGVAIVAPPDVGGGVVRVRRKGTLAELRAAPELDDIAGTCGIGHTRWATHGAPSERNSHPHCDVTGDVAIVHNGIIENHHELRAELTAAGVVFTSDTDTEVVAHLVGRALQDDPDAGLAAAVRTALRRLDGAYALAAVSRAEPDLIVAARMQAPLVAGAHDGTAVLASDIPALISVTRDVVVAEDGQILELRPGAVTVTDTEGRPVDATTMHVDWDVDAAERGGYPHFMLKEIHEQPDVLAATLRGRIDTASGRLRLDELRIDDTALRAFDKVVVVACGTSHNAGLVARYAIEHWVRIPVEIDIASEFRYRDPVVDHRTLVIGVSQSGETADTIAACRFASELGAKVVAVTNVVGSTMTREADAVIYTHAGPEIGVAATKTFTCQIAALSILALYLAQQRQSVYPSEIADLLARLERVPVQVGEVLADTALAAAVEAEANAWKDATSAFYLGRGAAYPTALEGALKMKEISYLHAEAYPAGELKHGPLALIEDDVPVCSVVTASKVHAKTLSNVAEVAARGGRIVAVSNPGIDLSEVSPARVFEVPATHELFAPIIDSVVLQLLAYHVATARGCNVDMPRNLAKTVTVE
jgi:glucosamine--fructose-6-phosphate aminotransferase (isomerizing)